LGNHGEAIVRYLCFLLMFALSPATWAQDAISPLDQFESLKGMTGQWAVQDNERLAIRFENTANETVVIERWETPSGLHSITVYHMDGPRLMATHYCPQGNQPRLAAEEARDHLIRFTFQDASDLDPMESYQHELSFEFVADGSVLRTERYWAPAGATPISQYVLRRLN
jgi:hypothetical protein